VDSDAQLTGRLSAAHSPDAGANAPLGILDIYERTIARCLPLRMLVADGSLHKIARQTQRSRESVDGDQLIDNHTVSHRRSIPFACDRIGVDRERCVSLPDRGPAQIMSYRPLGYGRHEAAPRIAEVRPPIATELDAIAVLMNITVVMAAE
jgi:hypothetical protein